MGVSSIRNESLPLSFNFFHSDRGEGDCFHCNLDVTVGTDDVRVKSNTQLSTRLDLRTDESCLPSPLTSRQQVTATDDADADDATHEGSQ